MDLVKIRQDKNFTQSQVATNADISLSFYSQIENGVRKPSVETAKRIADAQGDTLHIGNLYSSDTFYDDSFPSLNWGKMGCLAVEMEACALYCTAMRLGMRALAICTISDILYPPHTALDAESREKTFTKMMKLALDTAVEIENLPHIEPCE